MVSYAFVPLSRGHRFFRRRPIGIIIHDPSNKGKTVEEYVESAKKNSASLYDPSKKGKTNKEYVDSAKKNSASLYDPSKKGKTNKEYVDSARKNTNLAFDFQNTETERQDLRNKSIWNADICLSDQNSSLTVLSDCKEAGGPFTHSSFKHIHFLQYKKSNNQNHLQLGHSSKQRCANDIFLVEGWRLLAEGLSAGLKPLAIYYSRLELLARMAPILRVSQTELVEKLTMFPLIKTPYQTLQTWSTLTTSPGITGAFKLSEAELLLKEKPISENDLPLIVILDAIRDPSNLGSLIRCLAAAGTSKILLTKGCCDLWDTKVLRSACGGHFHAHICNKISWSSIKNYLPPSPNIFIADATIHSLDAEETVNKIMRPLSRTESPEVPTDESEVQMYLLDEEGRKMEVNDHYDDPEHLTMFTNVHLRTSRYFDVNYFSPLIKDPLVLIIGGETGLSNSSKKFAVEHDALQIFIPMANRVESLNSSVSAGIVIYEMLRQFYESSEKQQRVTGQEHHHS